MRRAGGYVLRILAVLFIIVGLFGALSQLFNCDPYGDLAAMGTPPMCPNYTAAFVLGGVLLVGITFYIISIKILRKPRSQS